MNRQTDKIQLDRSSVSTDKCFFPFFSINKRAADAYEVIEINRVNQFMT